MATAIFFPNFDPVMISIGLLDIHWYGMMYMLAILFAWWYANRIIKKDPMTVTTTHTGDFIAWTVVGVIVGGRLGFVLLYQLEYFFAHPLEIFKVWKGGMSFHGGFVGVLTTLYFYSRYHKIKLFEFVDLLALSAPMGIAFVRFGNFINGEHWGRVTDVPWAMIFRHVDMQPRHPSQLYEALLQGLLLFALINLANTQWNLRRKYIGACSGLFAILYAGIRAITEQFRDPDGYFGPLTLGQAYSIPIVVLGVFLIWNAFRNSNHTNNVQNTA